MEKPLVDFLLSFSLYELHIMIILTSVLERMNGRMFNFLILETTLVEYSEEIWNFKYAIYMAEN